MTAAFVRVRSSGAPDLPTSEVTRGQFVDALEIRGDIRPLKSIVLSAPMQSGELQIVKLAKNGSMVKAGDVVVEFDASTLQRTMQEKQSELKQAEAEIEQATAQARITQEQNATELMRSKYNVAAREAGLEQGRHGFAHRERAGEADACATTEQKLQELEAKITSDVDLRARRICRARSGSARRRCSTCSARSAGSRTSSCARRRPGWSTCCTNYRASGPWGGQQVEFREGDRAWPGAAIMELPDLSSVHLEARLDESDRGRLQVGQEATIRIEAIPGREFKATIERISVLANVDYSSGWPPARNFELGLVLDEIDPKIRPGMSAVARIATDRVPDVVLVPSEAIFQRDGHPVVYKLDGSEFAEQRSPGHAARQGAGDRRAGGVAPGDRVATRKPAAEMIRRKQ